MSKSEANDKLISVFSRDELEQIRNALGLLVIDLEQHRDLKRCYSYRGKWNAEEFDRATSLYRRFDRAMESADE